MTTDTGGFPGAARPMTRALAKALDDLVGSRATRFAFLEFAEEADSPLAALYGALALELQLGVLRGQAVLRALDQAARAVPADVEVPPLPGPDGDGVLVCDFDTGRPIEVRHDESPPPPTAA
jgi:hypothetical protein